MVFSFQDKRRKRVLSREREQVRELDDSIPEFKGMTSKYNILRGTELIKPLLRHVVVWDTLRRPLRKGI